MTPHEAISEMFYTGPHSICNLGALTEEILTDSSRNFSRGFPHCILGLPLKVLYQVKGTTYTAYAYFDDVDNHIVIFSGYEENGEFGIAPVIATVDEQGWMVRILGGDKNDLTDEFCISVVLPIQMAFEREGMWTVAGVTWN